MADFTKGEWTVITNGNTLMAIAVTNRNICSFEPLFGARFNRQVGGEDEANANLIAAAPDMYDALELVKRWCESEPEVAPDELVEIIADKVERALAKAEANKEKTFRH